MKRIVIVGGKMHSGGKKTLILEYYRHMDLRDIHIDLICDSDSNSIPYQEWRSLGGEIFVIPPIKSIVSHSIQLYRIFKNGNYDIVHGYDNTLNVFSMLIAKMAGISIRINESISMAHRGEIKTILKSVLKLFAKFGSTHYMANGIEAGVFQFGKKAFSNGEVTIFKSAIDVQTKAFDSELRVRTRTSNGWNDNVVYGFIGRFEPQKNPLFLIKVFAEISRIQDNAKLVIVGHGSLEKEMMRTIVDLNLQDRVENLGRTEDIKPLYNAFDAFILPSLYEGLPVVAVESQVCGLPIFCSTEVPSETAACEICHFISLSETPESWAQAIVSTLEKQPRTRRSYIEELKYSGFDVYTEAARLHEYYFEAVNGK